MSYEYASTLYDTEMERAVAMVVDYLACQGVVEGLESALDFDADGVREAMKRDEWRYEEAGDFADVWNCALGRLVSWARDELDMSQGELGEELSYSQKQISLLESGSRPVKKVVLRALLQMLQAGE